MTDCTDPEDVFAVLTTAVPHVPIGAWIAVIAAAVLLLTELSMRFGFGGVPDGLLGMLSLAAFGIALLLWASSWPTGCSGTIVLAGVTALGIAALVGTIILIFWRSRRHDGGVLVRGYGNGQAAPDHNVQQFGDGGAGA